MTEATSKALDHVALEALFGRVLEALESAPSDISIRWAEFDVALTAHFEEEERTLLADLLAVRPREARVVFEEHRYLRGRLAQLRAAVPAVPLDSARTFLSELRAHGRHEERVLYRWAEPNRPPTGTKSPS